YDPDIASDCYRCHPGNNVNCYRGHHTGKGLWCTDCHGDLNKRVAEGQLLQPWSDKTLPTCEKCHGDTGKVDGKSYLNMGIFGQYLNGRGHKDHKILCSSCHGEPHALYPSTLAADNAQNVALQGDPRAIGVCNVCHTDRGTDWKKPPH
ncbi:cytochrome C, partial [Dissulfurirhabdus thermomarina]